MKKVILPICLWLLLVLSLVFGVVISENNEKGYEQLPFLGQIQSVYKDFTKTTVRSNSLKSDGTSKVIAAYDIYEGSDVKGYAYVIESKAYKDNKPMQIMVIMDIKEKAIKKVAMMFVDTNDYFNAEQNASKFEFILEQALTKEITREDYAEDKTFIAVSGATYSRNALVGALNIARAQFYMDIEETLPVLKLNAKVKSVSQVYESGVFNKFEAVVNCTSKSLKDEDVKVVFTVDEAGNKTIVSSEKALEPELSALVLTKLKPAANYIKSLESDVFTVITVQDWNVTYTTTFKVVDNKVDEYHVEYTPGFTNNYEKPSDDVLNNFLNGFNGQSVEDASNMTGISGFTLSCNGVKDAFKLVNNYLKVVNGGAN